MNDQLRTLVRQAVVAVDIVTGNEALDDELAKMYIPDCFAEKFAELIVRECAEQVWYTREDGINGNVSEIIKERMKQHFGVEE